MKRETPGFRDSRAFHQGGGKNSLKPLVAEVFEGEAHFKILAPQKLDHVLKVVAFFSRHTNLPVLKSALHFEVLRFDGLGDLLGLVPVESLFDHQVLSGVPQW